MKAVEAPVAALTARHKVEMQLAEESTGTLNAETAAMLEEMARLL